MNRAAVSMGGQMSLQQADLIPLGYMPSGGTVRSIFSFLRNLHTAFHNDCTNVHPTDSVQEFPFLHTLVNIVICAF